MPSSIAIVGASGLLGQILVEYLRSKGHTLIKVKHQALTRIPATDVVINLAGCNITGSLWTDSYKQKILQSRVETTKTLVQYISPKLYIGASAIGYYGETDEAIVTESHLPGSHFLSEVAKQWEQAAEPLSCRCVFARLAPVLTLKGGFLGKMKCASRLGHGLQWQSWIHYLDFARAITHIIETPSLSGPINFSAPTPLRQKEFVDVLAHFRPRFLPVPACLLRLLPGSMGEELFLTSCRAMPKALLDSGFTFSYPDLNSALRGCLQIALE